jgi:hypothetical protein
MFLFELRQCIVILWILSCPFSVILLYTVVCSFFLCNLNKFHFYFHSCLFFSIMYLSLPVHAHEVELTFFTPSMTLISSVKLIFFCDNDE